MGIYIKWVSCEHRQQFKAQWNPNVSYDNRCAWKTPVDFFLFHKYEYYHEFIKGKWL